MRKEFALYDFDFDELVAGPIESKREAWQIIDNCSLQNTVPVPVLLDNEKRLLTTHDQLRTFVEFLETFPELPAGKEQILSDLFRFIHGILDIIDKRELLLIESEEE